MLVFGGSQELQDCKSVLKGKSPSDDSENASLLTTSPLDYHMFRQEITSKYPAYSPPPPLIPLEANNNSILPPVSNHESRYPNCDGLHGPSINNSNSKSIFHQPVHIATPAPSPPPSPAGPGGKGGKKQNYQTNQNFPFLYPPLDSSSNEVGGKGKAELQGKLVSKKWEGSDVPASILEASQLFASRMRMTRAMRQLWDIREEFIKSERGWQETSLEDDSDDDDVDSFFNTLSLDDSDEVTDSRAPSRRQQRSKKSSKSKLKSESDDPDAQQRLLLVEAYFVRATSRL